MTIDKLHNDKPAGTYNTISAYLAAAAAASIQTTGTHVLDTAAKRLQNNIKTTTPSLKPNMFMNNLCSIIWPAKTSSLWDGYKAALTYRVTASTITFGSQPLIQRYLEKEYGYTIGQFVGEQHKSTTTHVLSGAMFGFVEVAFLPLDKWKVLRQVNNTTPFISLIKQERYNLYAGSFVTCLRNVKSFSTMYGVSNITNQYFTPNVHSDLIPFYQRVITSGAGAVSAVIVSNPTDVVKTRILAKSSAVKLGEADSALRIAIKIYSQEGVPAFWRGILPRLVSVVPRLTFLKALSEEFAPLISKGLNHGADWFDGCSPK